MPRRRVSKPIIVLVMLLISFVGAILIVTQFWLSEDEMEEDIPAKYEPLMAKLKNGTPVRLIIELDVEYFNDALLAESAVQSQGNHRQTIREAIVEEFAPYRVDVSVIPFMSLTIYDEAALRRLMVSPYVRQFEEDIPIRGGPFDFPDIEPSPTP